MRVHTKDRFERKALVKILGPHQVLVENVKHLNYQDLMRVYTLGSAIIDINKTLRERENKENVGQEIRASIIRSWLFPESDPG